MAATIHTDKRIVGACNTMGCARYAIGHVLASRSNDHDDSVWLCATDGRQLSARQVVGSNDHGRLIPQEVFPRTRKRDKILTHGPNGKPAGQWVCKADNRIAEAPTGRFPDADQVVPADIKAYVALAIDARILAKLAEAIGDDAATVTLFLPPTDDYGYVAAPIPVLGEKGIGVLMPIAVDEPSSKRVVNYVNLANDFRRRIAEAVADVKDDHEKAEGEK